MKKKRLVKGEALEHANQQDEQSEEASLPHHTECDTVLNNEKNEKGINGRNKVKQEGNQIEDIEGDQQKNTKDDDITIKLSTADFKCIKRKIKLMSNAQLNKLVKKAKSEQEKRVDNNNLKTKKQHSSPFRRVKVEDWNDFKGIKDNSYYGNHGDQGWGAKANATLLLYKGKDFKHQKIKKKKGNYKGGKIDVNCIKSIKFDSE